MSRMGRRAVLNILLSGAGVGLLAACAGGGAPAAPPTPGRAAPPAAPPPAPTSGVAGTSAAATVAFTPTPVPPPAPAATGGAQPRRGGTLRTALLGDLPSLDVQFVAPNEIENLWLVFDRLTTYDQQLKPQPMLAESWDISDDYRQIKLNLRKGVQWHTGREFTSDDVKYNLLRVRDPKSASASSSTRATGSRPSTRPTSTRSC